MGRVIRLDNGPEIWLTGRGEYVRHPPSLPLPIIHSEFTFTFTFTANQLARATEDSRRLMEEFSRRVAQEIERRVLGYTVPVIYLEGVP